MKGKAALADAILRYTDRRYVVPGFPVTELGALTGAELVINEKTALEYALGDSLSGRRAAVIVKNVGVNACADPLLNATAQGLRRGVVLVAGDDPAAAGSQTTQDSRFYGEIAEVPVIEPDASCLYAGTETALEASEAFSRIALVRLTPGVLETESDESPVRRNDGTGRVVDPELTMNGRAAAATELYRSLFPWSSASPLNRWCGEPAGAGSAPGRSRIVTVHPVPGQAAGIGEIRESGRSFVSDHACITAPAPAGSPQTMRDRGFCRTFCRTCPFLRLLDLLRNRNMKVICDAGCSILAMNRPYRIGVASYGMGSSIAVAARSTRAALIGDFAIMHSGLNSLIDVYEKRLPLLCIVMKNSCAALTGRQPVGDPLPYLGWARPVVCRADDEQVLERELVVTDAPRTLVVEGRCPEGSTHETFAY